MCMCACVRVCDHDVTLSGVRVIMMLPITLNHECDIITFQARVGNALTDALSEYHKQQFEFGAASKVLCEYLCK